MRIAHVSDCYLPRLGGIERQVHDLAARQQEAGHDVEVITSVGGHSGDTALRVHRPSPRGDTGQIRYARTLGGLAALRRGDFELVHVHLSACSPLAILAARHACRSGLPVAATVHSMWTHATPLLRASAVGAGWRRWPIAWSAVSAAAAGPLNRVLAGAPVAVIPNGISGARWLLPRPRRDPRRVVIATVMRLAARKRPRQFSRMLAEVRRSVPEHIRLEVLIVGDGPLRVRLESDLRKLGIGGWVRLTGVLSRTEIARAYHDVDVYVAPARLESFGIAALEARAAGLPVLAYAGTGVADFVADGVNGLLAVDDAAMVTALRRLILDPRLRAQITATNRARQPAVSWSGVLDQSERLYAWARTLSDRAAVNRTLAGSPR